MINTVSSALHSAGCAIANLYRHQLTAKRASGVLTQTNSDKQNEMEEDLKIFQACKQVSLKQFLTRKLDVHFPRISFRARLCSRGSNNLHSSFRLRALRY